MGTLKIIVTVIFALIGLALTVIILMQEGKSAGLSGKELIVTRPALIHV